MLQVKGIFKEYRTGDLVQKALDGADFNLRDNEFVAILGPSGSGKTTLLNIIGGLDRYDQGDLIINGVSTKKYTDRDWDSYRNHTIGFVFQSYNLIPHQTLLANVELALTISGITKNERQEKAKQALAQVGLLEQCHKKPNQLSGGQMQRVAIARALVNDPDILLADEPTGALDSDTSIQVMDLLKEVAKERLVVMVTHNPELAEAYATRIVKLRDGKIQSDSDPYLLDNEADQKAEHKNLGKASMSFATALSLSFNNLKTKKGRTLLTAFAGSIGIIGIALILSLSNGVNTYIKTIEEDTLSEYPLQIQSTGIDITSMMMGMVDDQNETKQDEVQVTEMVTKMFAKIGSNDLTSFKQFLDGKDSHIDEYTNAVEFQYNVTPQIYRIDGDSYRQVHPDRSFQSLGLGSTNSSNSLMSMAMATDVFYPMPADADLYEDQYDVKAGRWPQGTKECVLVLTAHGSIPDLLLYTLGLRDASELDRMVKQFAAEETVVTPKSIGTFNYDDILGTSFKVVNAYEYYEYDDQYHVYRDKSGDADYMKKLIAQGNDLTVVGIVQPKENATAAMLRMGLNYPAELTTHTIEQAQQSAIVKAQLAAPDRNVFSGKSFDEDKASESTLDMDSLFSVDEAKLQAAFQLDPTQLQESLGQLNLNFDQVSLPPLDLAAMMSGINMEITAANTQQLINHLAAGFQAYIAAHPQADPTHLRDDFAAYLQSPDAMALIQTKLAEIIQGNGSVEATPEQLEQLAADLMSDYDRYAAEHGLTGIGDWTNAFQDYLNSDAAREIMMADLSAILQESHLEEQLSAYLQSYMSSAMGEVSQALQQELSANSEQFANSFANALHFDQNAFAQAFQFNMSETELAELLTAMMSKEVTSYDNNMRKLGYADFQTPSEIAIYPKDFDSKEKILTILDQYNDTMKITDEKKVITYTDFVGTLMSSVTDIVNVIGYVLIAFVAISLVVSSIMIGVITYISVLERKKEIGILRAMGASKQNVSQVFNAETFIIGLAAGLMGILITLLLLIPGNQLIHSLANQTEINAVLPVGGAVILILLSVVLTLIGGIIPSRKAAKEDPVAALRTE